MKTGIGYGNGTGTGNGNGNVNRYGNEDGKGLERRGILRPGSFFVCTG